MYKNYDIFVELGPEQLKHRRVVCAAIYNKNTKHIILGPRHFHCFKQVEDNPADYEQGFVDQYMHFLTREEAFILATEKNQIIKKTGSSTSKTLFSEDIY